MQCQFTLSFHIANYKLSAVGSKYSCVFTKKNANSIQIVCQLNYECGFLICLYITWYLLVINVGQGEQSQGKKVVIRTSFPKFTQVLRFVHLHLKYM